MKKHNLNKKDEEMYIRNILLLLHDLNVISNDRFLDIALDYILRR